MFYNCKVAQSLLDEVPLPDHVVDLLQLVQLAQTPLLLVLELPVEVPHLLELLLQVGLRLLDVREFLLEGRMGVADVLLVQFVRDHPYG